MAYKEVLSKEDAAENPSAKRESHVANNISSSISGPNRAGDIVAGKRMNLLHAQGEPQIGRREEPAPEAPWYKRKEFFLGVGLGALVVIIFIVIIVVLGKA